MAPASHAVRIRDWARHRMGRSVSNRAGSGIVWLFVVLMLAVFAGVGFELGALFPSLGGLLS
jgi:hypothetical protein